MAVVGFQFEKSLQVLIQSFPQKKVLNTKRKVFKLEQWYHSRPSDFKYTAQPISFCFSFQAANACDMATHKQLGLDKRANHHQMHKKFKTLYCFFDTDYVTPEDGPILPCKMQMEDVGSICR